MYRIINIISNEDIRMKKQLFALSITALLLMGCSRNKEHKLSLSVVAPSGAPALGLYKFVNDTNLEINADPTNLVAYMSSGSKDVIVLPTNAGVQAIKKGANYQIASTITFGNFYLASTGNDANERLGEGDYVVLFQQNNVPDKLFRFVYMDLVSALDIHYVNAASDAAACIVTGKNASDDNHPVDYVLIAEPALSTALSKNPKASEYANLQTLYKEKTDNKPITQASIFVKKDLERNKVKSLLNDVKDDINELVNNSEVLDEYLKDIDELTLASKFGGNLEKLKTMMKNQNRVGLGYLDAYENKESIDSFLSLWPAIGGTSEEIYFK